jgi:hypothetical protein
MFFWRSILNFKDFIKFFDMLNNITQDLKIFSFEESRFQAFPFTDQRQIMFKVLNKIFGCWFENWYGIKSEKSILWFSSKFVCNPTRRFPVKIEKSICLLWGFLDGNSMEILKNLSKNWYKIKKLFN